MPGPEAGSPEESATFTTAELDQAYVEAKIEDLGRGLIAVGEKQQAEDGPYSMAARSNIKNGERILAQQQAGTYKSGEHEVDHARASVKQILDEQPGSDTPPTT